MALDERARRLWLDTKRSAKEVEKMTGHRQQSLYRKFGPRGRVYTRKSHCRRGHEMTDLNSIFRQYRGHYVQRFCRQCVNRASRDWAKRRRQEKKECSPCGASPIS